MKDIRNAQSNVSELDKQRLLNWIFSNGLSQLGVVVLCRTVCGGSGGEQDASLLSFWRHSQHCLTHGVHRPT